jgi:SAM-dependent methyltransferase
MLTWGISLRFVISMGFVPVRRAGQERMVALGFGRFREDLLMGQTVPPSYSSTRLGLIDRLREMWYLYKMQSKDVPSQVEALVDQMKAVEREFRQLTGTEVCGLKILDIGAGQELRVATYFSVRNDVVGIDLDEIVQGLDFAGYYRMWRKNGGVRLLKTVGRRMLGLDRSFHAELRRRLGVERITKPTFVQSDAADIPYPDNSFDMVVSTVVFEHLADPAKVLDEAVRILKPGGVAHIGLHLYTSDSGCHDPRILSSERENIPFWAHLRPIHASKVRPNSYLNRLSLREWDELFRTNMPGVSLKYLREPAESAERLRQIRLGGELSDYSDEELLTVIIIAIWRKPESALA